MADALCNPARKMAEHQSRKFRHIHSALTLVFIVIVQISLVSCLSLCENTVRVCGEGECVNDTCVCFPGWDGTYCEQCKGRISLDSKEGIIYDGSNASYPKDRMCSWLLDTHQDSGNVSVRLVFNEFETECGWDHFYIHDGDSVFSPLLAAYSGLLRNVHDNGTGFEFNIRLSGRYGYLHFYSDAAYMISGFNISYSVGGCYRNCSGQGTCVDGKCTCDPGLSGDGCEVDLNLCLNNCSNSGTCSNGVCSCNTGFKGEDCSVKQDEVLWERLSTVSAPAGRASHSVVIHKDLMWVVGGYSLSHKDTNRLPRYDISSGMWLDSSEVGIPEDHPWPLYAHSTVIFEDKLYMYGGVRRGQVTDTLWTFDIASSNWTKLLETGYPVSGHTAHVVGRTMLIFFGYSSVFGYMNRVQQYDFDTGEWSLVNATGSNVQGGYGHASAYDMKEGKIYIFGGYHSHADSSFSSTFTYNLTDALYVYDVVTKEWLVLMSSGYPRYLHSMVVFGGYLLVFGGNTHNDTSKSQGAKCFSTDFMLYDIKCNAWYPMQSPQLEGVARFGHSMVVYNGSIFIFGGFDSVMLNDMVRVELGDCGGATTEKECNNRVPGLLCVWDKGSCRQRNAFDAADDVCKNTGGEFSVCPGYDTCTACLASSCTWCGINCTSLNCTSAVKQVNTTSICPQKNQLEAMGCGYYHTCQACQLDHRCNWDRSRCKPRPEEAANSTMNKTDPPVTCSKKPCALHDSCSSCTQKDCMWCSNLHLCVDTNAYVASFPYGQCMDWTTKQSKCNATECTGLKSCKDCLANSRCGWCNGEENNGLGRCMDGGMTGPVQPAAGSTPSPLTTPQPATCKQWFFKECPLCQCNGHATCLANSSICEECDFPTRGDQCQYCQHFFYGNPVNGGNCSECQCHGQADSCNPSDGQCYCHTRGVTGKHCDRCDDVHQYFGDPKNGGTCYYRLAMDYQYTFNLSKKDDVNYTQINFMSIPGSGDRDVDFTLNCTGFALINITFKSKNKGEEQITTTHECDYFRTKFEHKEYFFGGNTNSTFYVYVFGFQTPFLLMISFSQFPKIDLVHFFITFFSCFLSLLLIAAALWKIKHKYDSYRRRQQLIVEMQQMASRPFSSVCLEVERKSDQVVGGVPERKELRDHLDSALRRRKKLANKPSAIAIEPTTGNKAAVLTLLVQLPFADSDYAPSGQSGIAVGSALVLLGTTRKQSLEHVKGDRPKIRKNLHNTHPDNVA